MWKAAGGVEAGINCGRSQDTGVNTQRMGLQTVFAKSKAMRGAMLAQIECLMEQPVLVSNP